MTQIQDGTLPPQGAMNMFGGEQTPGWALGLRKLYSAAANEPVPSDFRDLLARIERLSARGPAH